MISTNTNPTKTNYTSKFNYDVPKKQAKSYEIDLGQNVSIRLILVIYNF